MLVVFRNSSRFNPINCRWKSVGSLVGARTRSWSYRVHGISMKCPENKFTFTANKFPNCVLRCACTTSEWLLAANFASVNVKCVIVCVPCMTFAALQCWHHRKRNYVRWKADDCVIRFRWIGHRQHWQSNWRTNFIHIRFFLCRWVREHLVADWFFLHFYICKLCDYKKLTNNFVINKNML